MSLKGVSTDFAIFIIRFSTGDLSVNDQPVILSIEIYKFFIVYKLQVCKCYCSGGLKDFLHTFVLMILLSTE